MLLNVPKDRCNKLLAIVTKMDEEKQKNRDGCPSQNVNEKQTANQPHNKSSVSGYPRKSSSEKLN